MAERVPEPGLPTLTRLPLRSENLVMPASLRATSVNGSGCTENTALRSLCGSLKEPAALNAWYCTSDWAMPKSSSPPAMALTL